MARLKETGNNSHNVILVKPGDVYKYLGQQTYTVNPQNSQDFIQLFESLNKSNTAIEKICFAWSLNQGYLKNNQYNESNLKASLEKGVYSFLFLCQALVEQKI
ncbi:MAG: hypothetical protein HC896_00815 [Bacteroidales bacterium]|nr:hypothetical protein [Bacteroidales bacterium]